jgi:hypothetical protein
MDYNLTKTVEGRIENSIDQAMRFGDMPPAMLMTKFEQTDMGYEDSLYDDFARMTLTDRRPDAPTFAHEEPRGGTNDKSGRLQLQYYGHRGDADTPYRPEYFDGFLGDEERDPRGINVDPDFKRMRAEEIARGRFQLWTPENHDWITGAGLSEFQVMENRQSLYAQVKERLKVFSRMIDGRREGMRREYPHVSNVGKQIYVQSYGDLITDAALNPNKRSSIICKNIIRDSEKYRLSTADADFKYAQYTRICKGGKAKIGKVSGVADNKRALVEDKSMHYKAAGILMDRLVRLRATHHDADLDASREAKVGKTAPIRRDIISVLVSINTDNKFADGDRTSTRKGGALTADTTNMSLRDGLAPVYHNASIIYKTVREGKDLSQVKYNIITDSKLNNSDDTGTRKAAKITIRRCKTTDGDTPFSESGRVINYRLACKRARRGAGNTTTNGNFAKSDNTVIRRPNHTNYRNPTENDTDEDMKYADNYYMERHAAPLGTKYTMGLSDRDSRSATMSEFT